MRFTLLASADGPKDARFDESLIALAASGGPVASVWEAGQGLVVPRTYQRHANFASASDDFARKGWPITVRQSGGGIVPQGPGILNLSLAYAANGRPLDHSDAAYGLICEQIQCALRNYGIQTHTQAVEGSFCDGRYNLAIGAADDAKKVVGTAQIWRRVKPQDRQVVLVHALILAQVDVQMLTLQANCFEQALGSGKRYDPQRIDSLHHNLAAPASDAGGFTAVLKQSLMQQLAIETHDPTGV